MAKAVMKIFESSGLRGAAKEANRDLNVVYAALSGLELTTKPKKTHGQHVTVARKKAAKAKLK